MLPKQFIVFFLLSATSLKAQPKYLFSIGPEYTFLGRHHAVVPLQKDRFVQGWGYSVAIQRRVLDKKQSVVYAGISYRRYKNNWQDTVDQPSTFYLGKTQTDRIFLRTKMSIGAMATYLYKLPADFSINLTLAAEYKVKSKYSEQFIYHDGFTYTDFSTRQIIFGESKFPVSIGLVKKVFETPGSVLSIETYYKNELFWSYKWRYQKDPYSFPSVGLKVHWQFK